MCTLLDQSVLSCCGYSHFVNKLHSSGHFFTTKSEWFQTKGLDCGIDSSVSLILCTVKLPINDMITWLQELKHASIEEKSWTTHYVVDTQQSDFVIQV